MLRLQYRCFVASFILNKKLFLHDVSGTALPSSDPLNSPVREKKARFFFTKFSSK
jgi:hypothetical protein